MSRSISLILSAVFFVAASGFVVSSAVGQAPSPAGSASAGKTLFMSVGCYECHGHVGEGSMEGPKLAPDPIAFDAFTQQLRQPASAMPAYGASLLSDAQVADLYAYVKSIPAGPAAKDIPILH